MKLKYGLAAVGLLCWSAVNAPAQDINFTGDGADLTFFYNTDGSGAFDVVFRVKESTEATGLTNPYDRHGQPGGSINDYVFDTLAVSITKPNFATINGTNYFTIGPASQADTGRPDLGLRTRLEDWVDPDADPLTSYNQFDKVNFELDWANSSVPTGADFYWSAGIETKANDFNFDYSNWGHNHFVFGFTDHGQYDLAFTISGDVNEFDGENWVPSGNIVSKDFTLSFSVVPEPSTFALLAAGLGCVLVTRRGRRPGLVA